MSQPVLCLRSLAPQIRFVFIYCVCMCVNMGAIPREIRKGCEVPSTCGCWKPNLSLLQEQNEGELFSCPPLK